MHVFMDYSEIKSVIYIYVFSSENRVVMNLVYGSLFSFFMAFIVFFSDE